MQPASIKQFDRYFLGSLVIGLVSAVLTYQDSLDLLEADPATEQMGFGGGFLVATLAVSFGISLLLWFMIARRASNVAKWILVVLTVLGVLSTITSLPVLLEQGAAALMLTLVVTALQLFAISFLFRADAKAWLESKGKVGPADPSIFD